MQHGTSRFYVYGHFSPNGELFYIGKGSGDRAFDSSGRNPDWHQEAVNHEVLLLEAFDTDREALDYEKELHILFGLRRTGGLLVNHVTGGGSLPEFLDIWKAKLSAHMKGKPAWNKGKSGVREETKEKMRAAKLGKKRGPYSEDHREAIARGLTGKKRSLEARESNRRAKLGTRHSEETKAKMSASHTGQKRSPQAKLNMSIAARGRTVSQAARAKMSATRKGVPWTASRRQRSMEVSL
jgi:hypothetical protein